jgi:hypothetical protein
MTAVITSLAPIAGGALAGLLGGLIVGGRISPPPTGRTPAAPTSAPAQNAPAPRRCDPTSRSTGRHPGRSCSPSYPSPGRG